MKQGTRIARRGARFLAAGAIAVGVLAPGAAFAGTYPNGGSTPPKSVDPGTQVEGTTASSSSSLPFTGGDVAGLTAIGGGAIVIGGLLATRARRGRART